MRTRPSCDRFPWRLLPLVSIVLAMPAGMAIAAEPQLDHETVVRRSREYLAASDDDQREQRLSRLAGYTGPLEPVIRELSSQTYRPAKPGYYEEKQFASSALREKYPDDLLYFIVPENYSEKRPTGLIVFMHGGGISTTRTAPAYRLDPSKAPTSHDMLAATGMITVGPSAPGKYESWYRWCLHSSEEYLADVIADCKERFNIDPDRVFLLGHSMGGFGSYHHALRQPDRFAAIIASAGAWDCGYWPAIRGTQLCIVHSATDAKRGQHNTDFEFARWTHKICERERLEHTYEVHQGAHDMSDGCARIAQYFQASERLRRDPYYSHIALASRQGFAWTYRHPVQHNRWLTLDKTTEGDLIYDELIPHGDNHSQEDWSLQHRSTGRPGAVIDAINTGHNRIEVRTQNVARFTIWLHPRMVDVTKPVSITVNGANVFSKTVTPSLATALESYERRRDWGLIYPIKVQLEVDQ